METKDVHSSDPLYSLAAVNGFWHKAPLRRKHAC